VLLFTDFNGQYSSKVDVRGKFSFNVAVPGAIYFFLRLGLRIMPERLAIWPPFLYFFVTTSLLLRVCGG